MGQKPLFRSRLSILGQPPSVHYTQDSIRLLIVSMPWANIFVYSLVLVYSPGISTAARVDIDDQFRKQRQLYVKAEDALKRRNIRNYHRYLKQIPDYPLAPLFALSGFTLPLE